MRRLLFRIILIALFASLLAAPHGGASAQPAPTTFSGFLSVTWDAGSSIHAELTMPDGVSHPLKLNAAQQGQVAQWSGQRVDVRGRMAGVPGSATIMVDKIAPAAARGK